MVTLIIVIHRKKCFLFSERRACMEVWPWQCVVDTKQNQ